MQCITVDEVVNTPAGEELVGVDLGGGSPPLYKTPLEAKGKEEERGERRKKKRKDPPWCWG